MSTAQALRAGRVPRRGRRTAAVAAAAVTLALGLAAAPAGASVDLPPGEIPVPASGTFLYLNSEPGDFVGGGVEHLYTSADSVISASLFGGSHFSAFVNHADFAHWFHVDMAAPAGSQLVVGSYEGAVRWPFQPPESPGLSVFGDGRGCNTLTGRFEVRALERAGTGELLLFEADFEQHCEGAPPALFGRIRIENPPPPPDETPPVLHLPGDFTVEAPDSAGTPVWYSASASDDRDPAPSLDCDPAAGSFFPVGVTEVTCTASDASGNTAGGSFRITVLAPLELGLSLSPSATVSARTGEVALSGTVSCSRDADVWVSGTITQLFARRVAITGQFGFSFACTAPSSTWSTTVTGTNGRFGAGTARVEANAFSCFNSCASAVTAADVRLRAGG